jgi:hypothetical protein
MRRVAWLVLLGGVCLGCGKRDEPRPDVTIVPGGPEVVTLPAADPTAGKVAALNFAQLWEPKGDDATNPEKLVKRFLAQRFFVKHQTEGLAAAAVGATLPQGGMHGVVMPYALARAYPEAAKKMEAEGIDKLVVNATPNIPVLDYSTTGTGAASVRVLVLRVKDGTDDELRIRFGEFFARLEEAVKGTGVGFIGNQRGGLRATGSLSDIRYQTPRLTGYARSVVVRSYDEKDIEFKSMMLDEASKGAELFKSLMKAGNGPFLVVSLREQRQ